MIVVIFQRDLGLIDMKRRVIFLLLLFDGCMLVQLIHCQWIE